MNAVARIFVVINLLLAGGFLLAAATFLHQNTRWKNMEAEARADLAARESELQDEITGIRNELTNAQSDLSTAEQSVTSLNSKLSTLQIAHDKEERAKLQAESELKVKSNALAALTSEVSNVDSTLKQAVTQGENWRQQSLDALEKQRIAEAAAKEALEMANASDMKNKMLQDQIEGVNRQLVQVQNTLNDYVGVYPPPARKGQPKVEGAVVRFDPGTRLVEINQGRGAGIAIGHEFDIVRGTDFIGTVRVTRVEDSSSVGSIYIPMPGRQPRSGDKATKL